MTVGPTLTAVLDWGRGAEAISDGIVDIGLLDARLLAETGAPGDVPSRQPANRRWSLLRHERGATVERLSGLRFDLDGVGQIAVDQQRALGGNDKLRRPVEIARPVAELDHLPRMAAVGVHHVEREPLDLVRGSVVADAPPVDAMAYKMIRGTVPPLGAVKQPKSFWAPPTIPAVFC